MRSAWVAILLVACGARTRVVTPALSPNAAPPAAPPPRGTAPSTPTTTTLGDWGVEIALPHGVSAEYHSKNDTYHVQLESCPDPTTDELAYDSCRTVILSRNHRPAFATLAEASKQWDDDARGASGASSVTLEEGTVPGGGFFTACSFDVRVGFSSHGVSVHTFKSILRVFAVLPLDEANHAECNGYLERGVDAASDRALREVRDVCVSMRLLHD